ncbi:MAG: hypothetical protein N4A48_08330 [Tepidibacter sp.]|uniref:hypothetical protein n=1 Tax=Tepidibacter sp. TaxID=2529387 RepID=UPI0025DA2070|nr:hypothetical protein [Tepidibacter sp.]MCT4508753.1 hypothetical protein [Tepidibacter sp.]
MACGHDFGIIDCLEEYTEFEYNPKKYNCTYVEDDLLCEIYDSNFKYKIEELDTFVQNTNRPFKSLDHYGITLIPPTSLNHFLNIILEVNAKYNSKEFEMLIEKISDAIKKNKWMIHYGV